MVWRYDASYIFPEDQAGDSSLVICGMGDIGRRLYGGCLLY